RRHAARPRRLRLRPAFPGRRDRSDRRRVAASAQERAVASRQGHAKAARASRVAAESMIAQCRPGCEWTTTRALRRTGPVMAEAAVATFDADALAGPRFTALPPLALYV